MMIEELVKQAAASGMLPDDFKDLITAKLRAEVPSQLSDRDLETDPEDPPKPERLKSAEEAHCEIYGAHATQRLHAKVTENLQEKAEAKERAAAVEMETDDAVVKAIAFQAEGSARGTIACLKAFSVLLVGAAAAVGEVDLLALPVKDWVSAQGIDAAQEVRFLAIAAVLLTFLGLLAHDAIKAAGKYSRVAAGAILTIVGLLLAHMRNGDGGRTMFCFWTAVSIGAPWATARCILAFFDNLELWLTYRAGRRSNAVHIDYLRGKLAKLQEVMEKADLVIEGIMERFTAAYRELASSGQRKVEAIRTERRRIAGGLSESMISFFFKRNQQAGPTPPESRPAEGFKMTMSLVGVLIAALLLLLVLFGVGVRAHAAEVEAVYTVVICDRSSSGGELSCSEDNLRNVFEVWARQAVRDQHGRFDVIIVGRDISDTTLWQSVEAPARRDLPPPFSQSIRRWQAEAEKRLLSRPLPTKARNESSSAVLEATYVASFRLAGRKGRKKIVLMSDLRQVTLGKWDFERNVPNPDAFLNWLKSLGSKPALADVDLTVCGFHSQAPNGGALDLQSLLRLRQAWQVAFAFFGKPETQIMEDCSGNF